jgi:hypothetical protein
MKKTMIGVLLGTLLVLTTLLLASCGKSVTTKSTAEGIVDSLAKSDFASVVTTFNPNMKSLMPADKLGQTWGQVITQIGQFKARTSSREAQEQGYDIVYVTCQFEKANLDVKVVFDNNKQVTGLFLVPSAGR